MTDPEILYEDADVLVINKPAGLAVHPDKLGLKENGGTFLTEWLIKNYSEINEVGEDPDRPGIVHRLDKDTSGAMIVAKNQKAFIYLKDQFKNHLAKKTYLAILVGEVKLPVGEEKTINLPIGRSLKDPRVRVASKKAYGKLREAVTTFRVAENFLGFTLVEASPVSGRTHQLRAHFKAYQHPIACDKLYGTYNFCPPGLARQALHAQTLALYLPNGEALRVMAPLPGDFKSALEHLRHS